ncbi:hypothetical protein ACWEOE_17865 [Amycolatopsis sp. NPDC004368]
MTPSTSPTTKISRYLFLTSAELHAVSSLYAALSTHFPDTLAALHDGTVDVRTAATLASLAGTLSAAEADLAAATLPAGRAEWAWIT